MAKIGREEYPELNLTQTIEITEKVGRQNVKTTAGLAQVMGLKSTDSGYFYHQASALTKYFGVINRTKDSVSLTPLGQRIAHPISDSDRQQALAEAAGRVGLLEALFEALGQSFHDADFKTKLRDVTGAAPAEIEKAAPYLERLYRDAIPYIAKKPHIALGALLAVPEMSGHTHGGGPPTSGGDLAGRSHPAEPGYRTFESDGVYLRVKRDLETLEEADAVLRAWLDRERKRPMGTSQSDEKEPSDV